MGQFSEHTIPLEVKRHFLINIGHPESAKVKVSLPAIPGYFASLQEPHQWTPCPRLVILEGRPWQDPHGGSLETQMTCSL